MSTFRFVHAADLHIDSPLVGLSSEDGRIAGRIRAATREAFEGLVGRTIEAAADFMIIAGDVYDGDWRDYRTGLFFAAQMGRLAGAGIKVFLIAGNHDAANRMTRHLGLPENVHRFPTGSPASVTLDGPGVALHGQGYATRETTENLVPAYPEPVPGLFNIGILHTALGGRDGHADYAPCTLAELEAKGYDYWALGHVHRAEVLRERPHVVFPGNLQGRHIRETGPRGAMLVGVEDGDVAALEPVHTDVVRWAVLEVPAGGLVRMDEITDAVRAAIEAAAAAAEGRFLACRIEIAGATALHDRLVAGDVRLLNEARAAAAGLGPEVAWVERVRVATSPAPDRAARRAHADALGELERMLAAAADDTELAAALAADPGDLARRLPPEIRTQADDPALRALIDGDPAALIREAGALLMARLAGDGD